MAKEGWIKLYRQIQECPIWYSERFSKGQAWVDLLLLANHRDKKIIFNGEMMIIKRGQYITSTVKLAEKWKWNRKTVTSFLKLLECEHMIERMSDNTKTLITIVNYEIYQSESICDGQPIGQANGHDNGQPVGQQMDNPLDNPLDTNKNDKNDKEYITVTNVTVRQTETVQRVVDEWNSLKEYGIKPISKLACGSKRYQSLCARINQYGIDDVLKAIDNIRHSEFLQGKSSKRPWVITFDWFVLPNNFPKVLEGQYNDKAKEVNNSYESESSLKLW